LIVENVLHSAEQKDIRTIQDNNGSATAQALDYFLVNRICTYTDSGSAETPEATQHHAVSYNQSAASPSSAYVRRQPQTSTPIRAIQIDDGLNFGSRELFRYSWTSNSSGNMHAL